MASLISEVGFGQENAHPHSSSRNSHVKKKKGLGGEEKEIIK